MFLLEQLVYLRKADQYSVIEPFFRQEMVYQHLLLMLSLNLPEGICSEIKVVFLRMGLIDNMGLFYLHLLSVRQDSFLPITPPTHFEHLPTIQLPMRNGKPHLCSISNNCIQHSSLS